MDCGNRSVEWAVSLFRPLLKDLHIQDLHNSIIIDTARYPLLCRHHMDKCIIVVVRHKFTKADRLGVFCWQYDKETDLFALYMVLNETLFENNDTSHLIERKATTTHEYTHCVAAILSVSRLSTPVLIERQKEKLAKKFHALNENDIKDIMSDIVFSAQNGDVNKTRVFDDNHFRTGDEDFPDDYCRLYRHLLFSYALFKEYCDENVLFDMIDAVADKNTDRSNNLFISVLNALSMIIAEKHLDKSFALAQFVYDIFPYALKKHDEHLTQ